MQLKQALLISISLILWCASWSQPGTTRLKGDSIAVDRAETMAERLGGKEIWSRARHLYIHQQGWFTGPAEPAVERTWRHFLKPRQRMEIKGRHSETAYVFFEEVGRTQGKKSLPNYQKKNWR